LKQFFQTLSVAVMFGVQTIELIAQRGNLYFVHPAPPMATQFGRSAENAILLEHLHISPKWWNPQAAKAPMVTEACGFQVRRWRS
jgi:hypothetical protein